MTMSLREFLDFHVKATQGLFVQQKHVAPMFIAEDPTGQWSFLPVEFPDDTAKDKVAWAVRQFFIQKQIQRYAYICEAWCVVLPPGTEPSQTVRPREHPDRVEIVCVEVEDKMNGLCAQMQIDRQGKVPVLKPPEYLNTSGIGRFSGLLLTQQ